MNLNEQIFAWMNSLAGIDGALDRVIVFVADSLDTLIIAMLVVFLLLDFHEREDVPQLAVKRWIKEVTTIGMISVAAWVIASLFKDIFLAARPFVAIENATVLFTTLDPLGSYPSGHATFFAALALVLSFYHKHLAYGVMVCAALIPLARVAAGVHFPLDVIGGWLLGGAVAYFFMALYRTLRLSFDSSHKQQS